MAWRVEKDGYSTELTDDLEIVRRGPDGRELQRWPAGVAPIPGVPVLYDLRKLLRGHRDDCAGKARGWAAAGQPVPRALAEGDPIWRRVLDDEGVTLTGEPEDGGLFARTYAGPCDSVMIQVLPEQTITYRDMLLREEGWEPSGAFRTGILDDSDGEIPFPERAIALHPGQEELAVEKVRALLRGTGGLPRYSKEYFDKILAGPAETAPALLVTLLDGLADLALAHRDARGGRMRIAEASAWFARARRLERLLDDPVDHARLAVRYGAYADARALPATALRAWCGDLVLLRDVSADDAERFRAVALRRVRAHGQIYSRKAADVRRLARAAGLDPEEELARLLRSLVAEGRMSMDDAGFWTDAMKRRAMDLLGDGTEDAVRCALALLHPRAPGGERDDTPDPASRYLWPRLMERTGAMARLVGKEPGLPDGAAAAWLASIVQAGQDRDGIWDGVYEAAGRLVPRLVADGVPVEFRFPMMNERDARLVPLDLIDGLLENGVPVADPPECLNAGRLRDFVIERRPELRHLLADARFERELRARLRAELDMTTGDAASNRWYQPHETKGWTALPPIFDNPLGEEVLREWCEDERERLREGVDLDQLVLLLGRFVHVGDVVDRALKDAEAAAQFAAVDVLPLAMAEMPAGIDQEHVAELMERTGPEYHSNQRVTGPTYTALRKRLPELAEDDFQRTAYALVMAVNCRVGLERLVRRLSPAPQVDSDEPASYL